MVDISASIAGQKLQSCLFNAAGAHCVTRGELFDLGKSRAGLILSKSCTLEPRKGNPEPRYKDLPYGSINSMGLPNQGYLFYGKIAKELKQHFSKPYFVSVSGLSFEDNLTIIEHLSQIKEIDALELNLSCPNIPGKPQVGYDFEQTEKLLDAVCKITEMRKKPLGLKLPPYFDFVHFEQMAEIIQRYPVKFVTCVNSIGNALFIDPEEEQVVIKPKGGFGGIGGYYVKPTALANVRKFYELLGNRIQIIGCGGVKTGIDAFEHILAGASAVQIATALVQEGPGCFARIEEELKEFMERKGYEKIEDFRGRLKVMD
ncbi:dihydroorotate oxidase [Candidatus Woesearchaeota archaeon]|nr:dihydroorotate oxidase [Candidatus Woesearchaeota archaeon]